MKDELLASLTPHGQQHLLAFWDELQPAQRDALARDLRGIDFHQLAQLFRGQGPQEDWAELAARAEAPPAIRLGAKNQFSAEQARRRGEEALAAGEVGVVLVAGGQGTRLGFNHPKGMFPIGPLSGATLFRILIEKIIARAKRHGVRIPLYLMTSPATDAETREYLQEHRNFGLEDLTVFCQGTMPAVDAQTGRVLLADKGRLFASPDGHGGMLAALVRTGALADMRKRKLRQLFYLQIDNPLVSMCDPEFLGYHLLAESELSTQVVPKRTSRDKVGNLAVVDGKLRIIEYSDLNPLDDEIVERKDAAGAPIFWAGNTAIHVFDVAFLQRAADQSDALPFHRAYKAVPFVDEQGRLIEPKEPNAIKFERFIFDLLPEARRGIVVEVDESKTFAPVKNAPSEKRDTPVTVQAQMIAVYRQWLAAAGANVAADTPVEISPLFAQDADETARKVPAGTSVTEGKYFH